MLNLSGRGYLWLALAASLGSLLAALYFQYVEGLAPCPMCIYQRYALGVGAGFAALALLTKSGVLAMLGGLGFLVEAGLAVWHSGGERKIWDLPASCLGGDIGSFSTGANLLESLNTASTVARCDEIPWSLFGLSMANYNILLSLGFAALCFMAARAFARSRL